MLRPRQPHALARQVQRLTRVSSLMLWPCSTVIVACCTDFRLSKTEVPLKSCNGQMLALVQDKYEADGKLDIHCLADL